MLRLKVMTADIPSAKCSFSAIADSRRRGGPGWARASFWLEVPRRCWRAGGATVPPAKPSSVELENPKLERPPDSDRRPGRYAPGIRVGPPSKPGCTPSRCGSFASQVAVLHVAPVALVTLPARGEICVLRGVCVYARAS